MLYYLHQLDYYVAGLNVFRYVTFRTAGASITALAIGLLLGPWMIRKLREFQIGQVLFSTNRYCNASPRCSLVTASTPARSAMGRATRMTR